MEMPTHLLGVFSGRQILHDRGGHVVVGLTDPARSENMRQHYATAGVHDIEMRFFAATQAQIVTEAEVAQAQLLSSRAEHERPMVDVGVSTLGHVTVRVASGPLNAVEAGVVARARATPSLYQVIEVEEIIVSKEEACDFVDDIECDPPLRGSVKMHTPTGCSVGFNVRSRFDNKPYVLTAGHCRNAGIGPWVTDFADDSDHVIGSFHNWRSDAETDVGIIAVDNPAGWSFGWPLITVDGTGGYHQNESYVIERVLEPLLGDRVCFTGGNSARTDCGSVSDISTSGGGYRTTGLFKVSDLCTMGGDSGSPYFSLNTAYGIHSGGIGGCGGGVAEHATEAEYRMNVEIINA